MKQLKTFPFCFGSPIFPWSWTSDIPVCLDTAQSRIVPALFSGITVFPQAFWCETTINSHLITHCNSAESNCTESYLRIYFIRKWWLNMPVLSIFLSEKSFLSWTVVERMETCRNHREMSWEMHIQVVALKTVYAKKISTNFPFQNHHWSLGYAFGIRMTVDIKSWNLSSEMKSDCRLEWDGNGT